ncbi:L-threonylcarbamoyladenylate synthase [Flavobacterium facile]|uniref:L-threonylcarbamoyladenylate synthase n=1 Tax=Flavobacterium facile TaxID=2893174 RepID=UPI002E798F14|nr:L-threonylcarbamoyladenylate synthase [Flavobacterium sp. T-12]
MISNDILKAATLLNENEVIGLPTETVYGLAANAYSETAIAKIFSIKKRPTFNPLIVHIKNIAQLDEIAQEIPDLAYELANKFWPGPLTLILKKKAHISNLITANQDTVAIRMPNHPVALELLNHLSFPLVAPSANPYTAISPTKASHVHNYFPNDVKLVLEGGTCSAGVESTIIGFENNKTILYRLGALALEDIQKVTGKIIVQNNNNKTPIAPGMTLKHYAPKTSIVVTKNVSEAINFHASKKIGLVLFDTPQPNIDSSYQIILSPESNLKEAAANLYNALHQLDNMDLDIIIAERFPEHGLGNTINDRLERATKTEQ